MKYFFEYEERQLLKILRDSKTGVRDRVIIELTLNTGLRVRELRLLNVSDIWNGLILRDHLVVRAKTAKRSKSREIFLNSNLTKILKAYIRWKKERGESVEPNAPLFISKKGGRVGQRTLQDLAEKWFVRAGLIDAQGNSLYSFHSLRHSFAMNLRRRGVNLERIQRLLGHASLQATGIYLCPSKEDLIEACEILAA